MSGAARDQHEPRPTRLLEAIKVDVAQARQDGQAVSGTPLLSSAGVKGRLLCKMHGDPAEVRVESPRRTAGLEHSLFAAFNTE